MLLTLPIREVVRATPRARIVRFDLDGHAFDYAPGQAVVAGEPGSDARRPYSIAAAPEDAARTHALELLVGVGTDGADGQSGPPFALNANTRVDIEGPVGTFTFPAHPIERNFIFVAGGTGIAPLRAMLRHAIVGPSPAHHVGLLYSARTPEEFAYEKEFRAMADRGALDFRQTVTRPGESPWSGARGRIDRELLAPLIHGPETLCFVCGPPALVHDVPRLLGEIGIARERIRVEEW